MDFKIDKQNIKRNLINIMRKAGYRAQNSSEPNQLSFVRPIRGGKFPRFHIYVEKKERDVKFSLHLDQRNTSYKGSHAHGAEYSGKEIKKEAERIKNLLLLSNSENKNEF